MTFKIKLDNPKDVKRLNEAALDYEGELTVNCGSTIIDAKSILALFTLIGRKNIKLVAPDSENPEKFIKIVKKIS